MWRFAENSGVLGLLKGQPLATEDEKTKTRIYVSAAFFSWVLAFSPHQRLLAVSTGVGWGRCSYIIIHTITETEKAL